jgi:hypothetical protein
MDHFDDGLGAAIGARGQQFERPPAVGSKAACARWPACRHVLTLATNVSEFLRPLEEPPLAALPFFIGCGWITQAIQFLGRQFSCFRHLLGAPASPLSRRRWSARGSKQRRGSRRKRTAGRVGSPRSGSHLERPHRASTAGALTDLRRCRRGENRERQDQNRSDPNEMCHEDQFAHVVLLAAAAEARATSHTRRRL